MKSLPALAAPTGAIRALVPLLAAASLVVAAVTVRGMLHRGVGVPGALLAALAFANATGLLRLAAWSRRLTVAGLWLAVLAQVGRFAPQAAGDAILAGETPSLGARSPRRSSWGRSSPRRPTGTSA